MKVALTTTDNPYSPFTDFTSWFLFDIQKGYNSCGYLARISQNTDDMTEEETDKEVERAIDEIIINDIFSIYKKVKPSDYKTSGGVPVS